MVRTRTRRVVFALLVAAAIIVALSAGPYYGSLLGLPRGASPASTTTTIPLTGLSSSQQQEVYSQAPWYAPINNQIADAWKGSAALAVLAVALAFAIAGLIFMVGIALKNERVRTFGLGELYEAIASAIIVGLFLYVCAVLFGLVPAFVVGQINPYATCFSLMTSTIQQAEGVYASLFQVNLVDTFYTSITGTVQVLTTIGGVPTLSAPVALYVPQYAVPVQLLIVQPANALATFISDALIVLYSEYYLLVFFSVAAIPAFLVPGVIFRAILPTRALGGVLVAFAIGVYLVMPTLFAVAYYFTAPTALQQLSTVNLLFNRYAAGAGAVTNGLTPSSPLVLELQNATNAMSSFWLLILFYPMLIIAVTYSFIAQVSSFIGGAYRAAGAMRRFI